MLKLEEINEEIKALENSNNTSYSVCQKLAILYIVRDHMNNKLRDPNDIIEDSIRNSNQIIAESALQK